MVGDTYKEKTDISSFISWLTEDDTAGHWYADPFILKNDSDSIEVLVEDFSLKEGKGRISKLRVSRISNNQYKLISKKVLLSDETHYSFPYVIRDSGKVYVCPENYQSGGVYLYEYDDDKEELINKVLIIDKPLVDTQICKIEGKYYAFGVETITGKMSESKCLKIFSSTNLLGPYLEHQTICNKKKEERGAGCIYNELGKWIRPAQCSEGRYGKELIIYELCLKDNVFIENEIKRYRQNYFKRNGVTLHTINTVGDLTVVDGLDYINAPFFSRVLDPVNKFILALFFKKYRR